MSDNKRYYYLRLKENFFDSPELKIIEGLKDGYLYSNILLKLYLRSLKNNGRLMLNGNIPYNPEMISSVTGHPTGVVKQAISVFKELGLIEILDNGAIYISDIQNFIGKGSTEADRIREYQRRIADEEKLLTARGQDCDCRNLQEIYTRDRDRDRDRDIPPYNPPKGKYTDFEKPITEFAGENKQLKEALNDWVSMRCEMAKKKKETFTLRALKTALKKLHNLSNGNEGLALDIVNEGIEGSWKSFYPLKDNRQKNKGFGDILDEYVDYAKEHSQ